MHSLCELSSPIPRDSRSCHVTLPIQLPCCKVCHSHSHSQVIGAQQKQGVFLKILTRSGRPTPCRVTRGGILEPGTDFSNLCRAQSRVSTSLLPAAPYLSSCPYLSDKPGEADPDKVLEDQQRHWFTPRPPDNVPHNEGWIAVIAIQMFALDARFIPRVIRRVGDVWVQHPVSPAQPGRLHRCQLCPSLGPGRKLWFATILLAGYGMGSITKPCQAHRECPHVHLHGHWKPFIFKANTVFTKHSICVGGWPFMIGLNVHFFFFLSMRTKFTKLYIFFYLESLEFSVCHAIHC